MYSVKNTHKGEKSCKKNNLKTTKKSINTNNINGYGYCPDASKNKQMFHQKFEKLLIKKKKESEQLNKIKLPQNYKKNKNFGYGGATYQSSGSHFTGSISNLNTNVIFSFPPSSTNVAIGTGSF